MRWRIRDRFDCKLSTKPSRGPFKTDEVGASVTERVTGFLRKRKNISVRRR